MPDLTPGLAVACLAVVCGACLQGVVGFGLGVLATPIVALVEPDLVPGPLILVAGLLTVLVLVRERGNVDLGGVGWALVGRLPGTLVGALAVASLPERLLLVTIGLLILVAVAISAVNRAIVRNARTLLLAGALSGVMATAASIGGPPIALAYQDASGPLLRGTLSAYFLVGTVLSLGSLALFGEFGRAEIAASVFLVPFALLGVTLSPLATRRLDGGRTRAVVLTVSALSAVVLLVRELAGG